MITPSSLGLEFDPTAPHPGSQDELEKEERRQARIDQCGSLRHRIHPLTHQWYSYVMRCKCWTECPACLKERALDFQRRHKRAVQQTEDNVSVIVTDEKRAKSLVRKLRNAGTLYWRIPTEGDIYIFFDNCLHEDLLDECYSGPIDWGLLASTPSGCRYSGDLGRRVEEEDDSPAIVVTIPDFRIELPTAVTMDKVFMEVGRRTGDLEFGFDEQEISYAASICGDVMETVVEEIGGICERSAARVKVTLNMYKDFILQQEKLRPKPPPLEVPVQLTYNDAVEQLFLP